MLSKKEPIKKDTPDLVVEHDTDIKKRYDNEILNDKSTKSKNTEVPCPREHKSLIANVLIEHNLWRRGENATPIRSNKKPLMLSNEEPVKKETPDLAVEHGTDFKKRYDNEILIGKSREFDNTKVPCPKEYEIPFAEQLELNPIGNKETDIPDLMDDARRNIETLLSNENENLQVISLNSLEYHLNVSLMRVEDVTLTEMVNDCTNIIERKASYYETSIFVHLREFDSTD